jgi:penicillin amidase
VPGAGSHEWTGFRNDLPRAFNPPSGFIATANHNINPKGYWPPLMFMNGNARYSRISRVLQMLAPGRKFTIDDHKRMQNDALSLRAVDDLPAFRGWTASDATIEAARAIVAGWDGVYTRDSTAAAIYQSAREAAGNNATFTGTENRATVEKGLGDALKRLTDTQGPDWKRWRWGRMHTRAFPHPFVREFDLPTVERPGGAGTVAADGASYREIMDVGDWDRSVVTNAPGQSGQPGSAFYGNLLPLWADNTYFTLAFSKTAVDAAAAHRLTLKPVQ